MSKRLITLAILLVIQGAAAAQNGVPTARGVRGGVETGVPTARGVRGGVETGVEKRPVTFDDVMQMKNVGSPAVSPDASRVLYTVRQWERASERDKDRMESRTHVWKVPADGSEAAVQITFSERGESQPQWSPDGRFISFVSARGTGAGADDPPRPQIHVMRTDGGEAWMLTSAKEGVTGYSWSPDSSRIGYVTRDPRSAAEEAANKRREDERPFEGNFRSAHLWTIDVASKRATQLTEGQAFTVLGLPSWSADGRRLAFSAKPTPMVRDFRSDVYIVDVGTRTIEKITTNPGSDERPQWSPDGARIAFVSEFPTAPAIGDGTIPAMVGHSHLMLYEVATRAAKDVSRPDFDFDPGAPSWSADSARIFFTAGRRTYTEAFAYDVKSGAYAQLTRNRTLQLGSHSRDGRVVAVTMDTPSMPREIYVTDPSFASFKLLTTTNPQAASFALGETEVVTWKSRDGMEIEGVLLKPVGYEAGKKYPMLTVAHGGPAGVFLNNYRAGGLEGGAVWAGEGWAVFYPNPRGSANYGDGFVRANINDWGGGDYRDIMTGIDALVARGIADPDRLAHIGWSYGGYMTAWVITQTPRFKAAMVGAGLTNLWSMYGTNDIPNVLGTYFGGIPDAKTLALYRDRSALSHVDKVTTPTLILHGSNDERVPIGQPMELFRALKDRGRTVELVFYPREGHGLTEYYHLRDRLERIHDWVTRYTLGGTGKKTTS